MRFKFDYTFTILISSYFHNLLHTARDCFEYVFMIPRYLFVSCNCFSFFLLQLHIVLVFGHNQYGEWRQTVEIPCNCLLKRSKTRAIWNRWKGGWFKMRELLFEKSLLNVSWCIKITKKCLCCVTLRYIVLHRVT